MQRSSETGTDGASVDVFVAFRNSACVVQCETRCEESDGHGVHADVHPSDVLNAVPEVKRKTEQQAPSGRGALAPAHGGVVQGRPGVVDDEATEPSPQVVGFVDGFQAKNHERETSGDENRVTKHFVMEPVNGFSKSSVGGFEREQATPRDVLRRVGHAEHVEDGEQDTPCAEEDHGRCIDRCGPSRVSGCLGLNGVAHGLGD